MGSKKAPKPSPEQVQIQKQQLIQLTELDEEENKRRKQLLNNAAGLRAFKGSVLTRASPSNTAGRAPAPINTSPGTPSGGAGGPAGGSPSPGRSAFRSVLF